MGKRSKELITREFEQHKTEDGSSCDLENMILSKKLKKKSSPDVINSANPSGGEGEGKCKNVSSESFRDIEFRNLEKKKKKRSRKVDRAVSDQEVYVKPKMHKNKADIQEEGKVNLESDIILFNDESTFVKRKNKKLSIIEFDHVTPLDTANREICKNHKTEHLDNKTSLNINTEKQIEVKKKKIVKETVENTEIKADAEDFGSTKTKKKKKKHQLIEKQQEIQGNGILNLNETTSKDKKKKKKIDTELNVGSPPKKIEPAMAKFNAEEAAVTEEEINQFCDEIDEEDNKQYEDWVQQIESMLGPRKRDVKEK